MSRPLPAVSIILVSWNSRELLMAALDSFLPLDTPHEVIVVDNASSDGSADAVERDHPDVRVIRSPTNRGFAGGVNLGIEASRGGLVLLLNPDTRVLGDAIPRLVAYLADHPEAGIVGPRVLNEDGSLQASRMRFPSLLNEALAASFLYQLFPGSRLFNRQRYGGCRGEVPAAVDVVSGCCLLVRRALLDQIGLLDESYFMYAEETDLCYRARRAGVQVHFAPGAAIVHLGGGSSRLAARRNFLEQRRSVLRFYRKHRGRLVAELARALLLLFLCLRIPYWWLRARRSDGGEAEQLANYLAGVRFLLQPLDRILDEGVREG